MNECDTLAIWAFGKLSSSPMTSLVNLDWFSITENNESDKVKMFLLN